MIAGCAPWTLAHHKHTWVGSMRLLKCTSPDTNRLAASTMTRTSGTGSSDTGATLISARTGCDRHLPSIHNPRCRGLSAATASWPRKHGSGLAGSGSGIHALTPPISGSRPWIIHTDQFYRESAASACSPTRTLALQAIQQVASSTGRCSRGKEHGSSNCCNQTKRDHRPQLR